MHVAFDVSPITSGSTGIGQYCLETLSELRRFPSDSLEISTYSFGRNKPDSSKLETMGLPNVHIPIPARVVQKTWDWLSWPDIGRKIQSADLCHSTNYYLPSFSGAKRIITVHDISFIVAPEYCDPWIVSPFQKKLKSFCEKADGIAVVSEFTRSEVINNLGIPPEKIFVTPNAVAENFCTVSFDEATVATNKYGIEKPYLLFVGTLEYRKNISGLLEAFAKVADKIPHDLVLIGNPGWQYEEEMKSLTPDIEGRVIFPGYVAQEDLPAFYREADLFLYLSHYEGFGIPILEAFASGCPVIASNIPPHKEIGGDAPLYVDPNDADGIGSTIEILVGDQQKRKHAIETGRAQARKYTWKNTAHTTFEAYTQVLS